MAPPPPPAMLISIVFVPASYKNVLPAPTKLNVFTAPGATLVPAELIPILKPPPAVTIPANAAAPFVCIVPTPTPAEDATNTPPFVVLSVVSPTTSPPRIQVIPVVLILPSL